MSRRFSILASGFAAAAAKGRTVLANAWRVLIGEKPGEYRPELHYMRGPGPKWRAKNAQASPRS